MFKNKRLNFNVGEQQHRGGDGLDTDTGMSGQRLLMWESFINILHKLKFM